MKVKLLKKLRKRYSWYRNTDGLYVLVDKLHKDVKFFGMKYYEDNWTYPSVPECGIETYLERCFKTTLFGITFKELIYRDTCKKLKIRKK